MSTIVITGGLGFVGSHVIDLLSKEDYNLVIIDNEYTGKLINVKKHLNKNSITIHRVDIRDREKIPRLLENADAVIHLAAIVSIDKFLEDPYMGYDVNAMGTLNIVESCRKNDIDKIVFASSTAVYGDPIYIPIDENHPTNPKSLYGASKLSGEKILFSYSKTYGIKGISLRFFNIYGPRMTPGPYAGVIYKFIKAVLKNESIIIYGNGKQTRDFVYVEDVAEAILHTLRYNASEVFNVGTGQSITILELAKKIMNLIGRKVKIKFTHERPGDIKLSQANIKKISEKLGWKPRTDLLEGLSLTISYLKSSQRRK